MFAAHPPTAGPSTDRFHALAWPLAGDVLRTARRIVRDDAEAQDLTQETMIKAYRRIDAVRDPPRVRPWLMAILRNTRIDHARAHRRRELSLDDLAFDPADPRGADAGRPPPDHRQDPDAALAGFADGRMIAALRRLPREIRRTLLLVVVEGLAEADAAAALGVPVGTIKSRLHRGRNLLRDALYPLALEHRLIT